MLGMMFKGNTVMLTARFDPEATPFAPILAAGMMRSLMTFQDFFGL